MTSHSDDAGLEIAGNPGIEATFCDVRGIAGRKVLKLVLEVPIEMRNAVLERLGGYPDASDPVWVMVVPFKRPE